MGGRLVFDPPKKRATNEAQPEIAAEVAPLSARYRYTKEEVAAALEECGGRVPCVAEKLGCSGQTVYNYMLMYPTLKAFKTRARKHEEAPVDKERRIQWRLDKLRAISEADMFIVEGKRYLPTEPIASILGKSRQTVNNWCKSGAVFAGVTQTPEYKGSYLIPYESVEAAIQQDEFPRPGHPGAPRQRHPKNGTGAADTDE